MTGVAIGQIAWLATIGDQRYTTSATGKASGVLSVLVSGEGAVDVRGLVAGGHLAPRVFVSKITDDDGPADLHMTFDDGVVKELTSSAPPPNKDRVPITDADRQGVIDPLSAMLLSAGEGGLTAGSCERVLAVFDGRRRYDLTLSYKRMDAIALERSYSGTVLVCGVILRPIAGYRADSTLVKYVAGRRDMELWFAPVFEAPNRIAILAPIRIVVPTLIGTLEIVADQFENNPPAMPAGPPRP